MRTTALLPFFALAAVASADRVIDVPTARKIPFGTGRLEYDVQPGKTPVQLGFLDLGVGTSLEATLRTQRFGGQGTTAALDLNYNLIAPVLGISPGIAFGVRDVTNSTRDGIRLFACTTLRKPFEVPAGELPVDFTFGALVGKRTSPYGAVMAEVLPKVRFMAEYDGFRLSEGAEIRPLPDLGVRFIFRGRTPLLGLSLTKSF